jgi:hypothetical protein
MVVGAIGPGTKDQERQGAASGLGADRVLLAVEAGCPAAPWRADPDLASFARPELGAGW